MSTSGSVGAALEHDPAGEHDEAGARTGRACARSPQPQSLAREIASSGSARPTASSERAADVDAAGRADGRLGDEELGRDRGEHGGDRAEPEDAVVGGVVGDHAAEDQAGAAADAERRRDQADAARDLLARELVADDPEAEREDAAAGALQDAAERRRPRGRSPSAETTEPAANSPSATTSSRRLPNMSPRRPKIGVQTAAESR